MMSQEKERFSNRARMALLVSEIEARYFRQHGIRVPHVLLGLYDEHYGVAGQVLRQIGFQRSFLIDVIKGYGADPQNAPDTIEITPAVKQVLSLAVDEARRTRHTPIGTGHLLIAIVGHLDKEMFEVFDHLHILPQEVIARTRQANLENPDPLERAGMSRKAASRSARNETDWWGGALKTFFEAIGVAEAQNPAPEPDAGQDETARLDYDSQKIAIATEVLLLEPDNAELYAVRAGLYSKKKDLSAAIADYSEAIRINPNYYLALCDRGSARLKLKDFEGAIADFSELIRLRPEQFAGYYNRGVSLFEKAEYDRAILDLTEAQRLSPESGKAFRLRAAAHLANNEQERAIADSTEALKRDANDHSAYHVRGTARADLKDYDGAEADFKAMYRLCPDFSWSHSNLGWLHLLRGNLDEAIVACTEAIRLNAENGQAYYNRGTALAAKGDSQSALADYRKALEYWTNIHSKHSEHYAQEMQSYISQWAKSDDHTGQS